MSRDEEQPQQVLGERGTSAAGRVPLHFRLSNILALGLMSVLGLGLLTWYYANAFMRQDRVKQNARAAATRRAEGDAPLPSLGRIDPPPNTPPFDPLEPPPEHPPEPTPQILAEIPLRQSADTTNGVPQPKTPAELGAERALSGAVFAPQPAPAPMLDGAGAVGTAPALPSANPTPASSPGRTTDELGVLLQPTLATAVRAHVLPTQRLLLPKGAFLDCTLETAIDSTLPGMTTCVMATDAFGADGSVVLLERGTKLIGETRGAVQQGAARLFVLWTEARTPAGVIVPLDSPGTDELGRAGLPGEVSRHFWQRFGAAMLVSVIDGAVQAAAQSSRGSGTVVVNPSASQDVLTEILKSTIAIAPTISKHNGDRIQVLVARDLDFSPVYELRSAGR